MTDTLQYRPGEDGAWDFASSWDYDYDELVTSRGAEIVHQESDNNYQGDTWYLLRDGDRYGYLVVGWGSCSGCDALQACETFEAVQQLRDDLVNGIYWGTRQEVREHILAREQANDWYADDDTFKTFRQRMLGELG